MLRQILCLLTVIFLSSSWSSSKKDILSVSAEEKKWLCKFFYDLLFVEGGAFTIWGSKPVTEIVLYHYTDEEMHAMGAGLSKEEKENCYMSDNYDLPCNWDKWEKIRSRFPMKKYLIFRSHFDEDGKASFVYVVDILNAATTIQSNYELFKKAAGFDFHPVEVVLDMQNNDSLFWKKVRATKESSLLWGLLFGYGKKNSCAFYWKYFNAPQSCADFLTAYPFRFSNRPPCGQVRISLDNFTIPQFVSFSDNDEMIRHYEEEREAIRKIVKKNNMLELTLQKLIAQ